MAYLQKPVTPVSLATKLREVLDRDPPSSQTYARPSPSRAQRGLLEPQVRGVRARLRAAARLDRHGVLADGAAHAHAQALGGRSPPVAPSTRTVGSALFRRSGTRFVHGGPSFDGPTEPHARGARRARTPRAAPDPDHMPRRPCARGRGARAAPGPAPGGVLSTPPSTPHDAPRRASRLRCRCEFRDRGIERYGFHGLSCAYLAEELGRVAGERAAQGRVVLAHLGSGSSLTALRDGRSVDTTMGFTPTSGVPMGTRSGDLDPGVLLYLLRSGGLTADAIDDLVNRRSGLAGRLRIERRRPRSGWRPRRPMPAPRRPWSSIATACGRPWAPSPRRSAGSRPSYSREGSERELRPGSRPDRRPPGAPRSAPRLQRATRAAGRRGVERGRALHRARHPDGRGVGHRPGDGGRPRRTHVDEALGCFSSQPRIWRMLPVARPTHVSAAR